MTRQFESGPDGLELLAFGAATTASRTPRSSPGWWDGDGDT